MKAEVCELASITPVWNAELKTSACRYSLLGRQGGVGNKPMLALCSGTNGPLMNVERIDRECHRESNKNLIEPRLA